MIEPAKGTSKYRLGTKYQDMDFTEVEIIEIEDRDPLKVYKSKSIWFFFDTRNNELDQISLFSPFDEKVLGKVGIGDKLSDVFSAFGKCSKIDKVYEPFDFPGIAFNTIEDRKSKNAVIEAISVSIPYKSYVELPQHFLDNLPGKKRKLP
jgi:hypothetical protein